MIEKLFQALLTLIEPVLESIKIKIGGANLVFGNPYIDSRSFIKIRPPILDHATFEFGDNMRSGGTITPNHWNSMRQSGQINQYDTTVRYYLHIPIINKQKLRNSISTAKDVYAKIRFFDLSGKPIDKEKSFDGRWENTKQPSTYENIEELRFVDIIPEDVKNLDIASKNVNGGFWYVWNNDSYKNFEYADNKINNDGFIFLLQLNGSNIYKKTVCYKVIDDNQEIKIMLMEERKMK